VTLFYTDHYEIPLPAGHKFPIRKYRLLREALTATGRFQFAPAPLAEVEAIERIHTREYVRGFVDGVLPAAAMRRIGLPWSHGLVLRTLASVGSTLAAADVAIEHGWGGGLAGGTHHAFRDEGSGFCVFNDIAVTIAALRADGRIGRAAVIDLDVHQGDGTAKIFEDDEKVFTVSVHGRHNFPFRKQVSRLDVELEDGTRDEEFLKAVRRAVTRAFEFRPSIVFYQSGVDGLASDKLGRMQLSHDGLIARDRIVFEASVAAGVPCVIVLGGGYSDPIELTVQAHTNTFCLASDLMLTRNTASS
jgi:acetoin utilization deacetylase AcuC-like enzyme